MIDHRVECGTGILPVGLCGTGILPVGLGLTGKMPVPLVWGSRQLAVTRERVQDNFRRYGLLDQQVRFREGWFRDTLPRAPIERLAVLRLDGDLYESTIQALEGLYDRLSAGGYVIVDDYGNMASCRQAVHDFRA